MGPTIYQAEVLAALHGEARLTVQQLAEATARGVRTVRNAVAGLSRDGQVAPAAGRDAWTLTDSGRSWLKTSRGRTALDFGRRP